MPKALALLAAALLLLAPTPVAAEPTPIQKTADAVLAAVRENDTIELERLASLDTPDPWVVAEVINDRGEAAAALAFATAAPRPATKGLDAYLASREGKDGHSGVLDSLGTVRKLAGSGKIKEALKQLDALAAPADTVTGVHLLTQRAQLLSAARQAPAAAAAAIKAAESAAAFGYKSFVVSCYRVAAIAKARGGDLGGAEELFMLRLKAAEALGDPVQIAFAQAGVGRIQTTRGDFKNGIGWYEKAIPVLSEAGQPLRLAEILSNMGITHIKLGDHENANAVWQRALSIQEAEGDINGSLATRMRLGLLAQHTGEQKRALKLLEGVLKDARKANDQSIMGLVLGNLGVSYRRLGNYPKALRMYRESLDFAEKTGHRNLAATSHSNIGAVSHAMGQFPAALEHLEQAEAIYAKIGNWGGAAGALSRLGTVYVSVGKLDQAVRYMRRALEVQERTGDTREVSETLMSLGQALQIQGRHDEATHELTRAVELAESLNRPYLVGKALNRLGENQSKMGQHEAALKTHQRAEKLYSELGDRAGLMMTLNFIVRRHLAAGDVEATTLSASNVLREARRLRATVVMIDMLGILAKQHADKGEYERALGLAQQALPGIAKILVGLDEASASIARESYAHIYQTGTLAAIALDATEDALAFLENGRAGALLESLDARQFRSFDDLPEELRDAERKAKADLTALRRAYEAAARTGKRKATRAAAKALDGGEQRYLEVASRIQRDAKRQAGMFYPQAATMGEIQGALAEGEALVLYGLCAETAVAFVLTADEAHVRQLGTTKAVVDACAALDAADGSVDPKAALEHLRATLIKPLDLPKSTTRLLISPEGPLCLVPYGALVDLPLAIAASGTTHVLMRDEMRDPGEGILALGDPVYDTENKATAVYAQEKATQRGARGLFLAPLPSTRKEVETIGTHKLLGADANEAKLRALVSERSRWRSIHLACHGLVNLKHPTLSSLALSKTDKEDGFLTAVEVLRMRMPTDIAVLSACETGTGRLVKGEGIVGLTRAFMYAGAQRVLCSLWKVDDAATQALMVKFYELWNPTEGEGLSAAEALKKAQEHVRSQEKWEHPYFWAAWVLWGLPE